MIQTLSHLAVFVAAECAPVLLRVLTRSSNIGRAKLMVLFMRNGGYSSYNVSLYSSYEHPAKNYVTTAYCIALRNG